jgi:hypothetical protein
MPAEVSNPIVSWCAILNGDAATLKTLASIFTGREHAQVITQEVPLEEEPRYVLHSTTFDGLRDHEIRPAASELLNKLNGAAMVSEGLQPVSLDGPVALLSDGTLERSRKVERTFHVPVESLATVSTAAPSQSPVEPEARRWLRLALTDGEVANALRYLARADNWSDLYKAFEVLEYSLGTRKLRRGKSQRSKKGGRKQITTRKWATKAEVDDLAGNINQHRHHGQPYVGGALSFDDARKLLRRIMRAWLEERHKAAGLPKVTPDTAAS